MKLFVIRFSMYLITLHLFVSTTWIKLLCELKETTLNFISNLAVLVPWESDFSWSFLSKLQQLVMKICYVQIRHQNNFSKAWISESATKQYKCCMHIKVNRISLNEWYCKFMLYFSIYFLTIDNLWFNFNVDFFNWKYHENNFLVMKYQLTCWWRKC